MIIMHPRNSARLVGGLFLTAMVSGGLRFFAGASGYYGRNVARVQSSAGNLVEPSPEV